MFCVCVLIVCISGIFVKSPETQDLITSEGGLKKKENEGYA